MTTRVASHAGSWYSASSSELSRQLDEWLTEAVTESKEKELKIPGARVIIAPHAGYMYSGYTAAWAYQSLDLSQAKHIFLLGPSHTRYLSGCALSTYSHYATPLGDLKLDRDIIKELRATKKFIVWDKASEVSEHSLEMHLPYIYKMLSRQYKSDTEYPSLIPILVGATSPNTERLFGQILAPYLAKPTSVFIVSSDFCHWGLRFEYTRYIPESGPPEDLELGQPDPVNPPIYESIDRLDKLAMNAIEGGKHQDFIENLRETGNTVCGRHAIGVIMAALEVLIQENRISGQESNISSQESNISGQESNISDQESNISSQESNISGQERGRFKFIQYNRNVEVKKIEESSVSYASAVAIL